MERLAVALPGWLWETAVVIAAVLGALLLHAMLARLFERALARSQTLVDGEALRRLRGPTRWLFVAFALTFVQPGLSLPDHARRLWTQAAGLAFPALVGWLAIALLGIAMRIVQARADISVADNLRARRQQTRAAILHRIGAFLVLLATFCMMLMSIPSVRSIGVTLIASAGLAALAVGAAAQPALKNLIGGLQMAFTEPIRLDDVVIIDGEWGRIEEITLTYVVVRIWDERRLIVPVSKFLEGSFENWTRQTSQLLGSVFWYLDPAADIARFRAKLEEVVRSNARWDGRFQNVQVTDTQPDCIQVRALMTAKDASTAFDLRCDVREAMLAFVRSEMPDAITRHRAIVSAPNAMPIG